MQKNGSVDGWRLKMVSEPCIRLVFFGGAFFGAAPLFSLVTSDMLPPGET